MWLLRSEYVHCCVVNVTDDQHYDFHDLTRHEEPDLVVGFFGRLGYSGSGWNPFNKPYSKVRTALVYLGILNNKPTINNCVTASQKVINFVAWPGVKGRTPYGLAKSLRGQS